MPRRQPSKGERTEIPGYVVALAGIAVAVVTGYLSYRSPQPETRAVDDDEAIAFAQEAISSGRFGLARDALAGVETPQGRYLRGLVSVRSGRLEDSVADFESLFDDASLGVAALSEAAAVRLAQARPSQALRLLERAASQSPGGPLVAARLAYAWAISGQVWRALPELQSMLKLERVGEQELSFLARPTAIVSVPANSDHDDDVDPLILLGRGWEDLSAGRIDDAQKRLDVLQEKHPDVVGLADLRLMIGFKRGVLTAMDFDSVAQEARRSPVFWTLRGRVALDSGDALGAARCGLEAQQIVPDHLASLELLRAAFGALGQNSLAADAAERGRLLAIVNQVKDLSASSDENGHGFKRLCEALIELDRNREAELWALFAETSYPKAQWPRLIIARAREADHVESFVLAIRRDDYRLPTSEGGSVDSQQSVETETTIAFRDDAVRAGLVFQNIVRDEASTMGRLMQEFTGSGICVMDYDRDFRPDLFFPQQVPQTKAVRQFLSDQNGAEGDTGSLESVLPQERRDLADKLFRNRFGQRFETVTDAGIDSLDHSQGATAGDVDGDGFADLYVANVGPNCLYLNNGDGTFTRVDYLSEASFTASVGVADVDADGFADLIDVNYVTGEGVYTETCLNGRSCSPLRFEPTRDTYHTNKGDGEFASEPLVTSSATLGNGLGLLIGRLKQAGQLEQQKPGRLDIYVANDQTANYLITSGDDTRSDVGLLEGVAFSRDGVPEAGMGIAWGDVANDGFADLFVTNFLDESNTLYQQSENVFVDETTRAGLSVSSEPYVGFGTEFLDADLDGDMDLIVTNGHIDDFRASGIPFAMPPLVYRNISGRFEKLPFESGYLADQHVGRSLARVDWDGDHRDDVVIGHLEKGPALLTNIGETPFRAGTLQLIGTRCHRDAVGAIVRVDHPDTQLPMTLQVTAGDGYMVCNSKALIIPTGTMPYVGATVEWPDGSLQPVRVTAETMNVVVQEPR